MVKKNINMDSYELDNAAYGHMRKHGIQRTKKSGPRKGETVHETVGGKPFKGGSRAKDAAIKSKIEGAKRPVHNAYSNYLQYKRMDKADPSGALKSRIKSGMRHSRRHK